MVATRRQLAIAAITLFVEEGYQETTMEAVARAAGVSRRTLFRYFPTKESLLLEPMSDSIRQFAEQLSRRPDAELPADSMREVTRAWLAADAERLISVMRLVRMVRLDPAASAIACHVDHELRSAICAWVAHRMRVDERAFPAQLFAAAAVAARDCALRVWSEGGGRDDLTRILDDAYTILDAVVWPASRDPS